jgi:hypothetical protein
MRSEVDLGEGVVALVLTSAGRPTAVLVEFPRANCCLAESHIYAAAGRCAATCYLAGATPRRPSWTLVSERPLELAPAVACACGGWAGSIADGRWVTDDV